MNLQPASPGYGWLQPGGYQVVTDCSPNATDDAPPVHIGSGAAPRDEAEDATHANTTSTVTNASLTTGPLSPSSPFWTAGHSPYPF